MASSPQPEPHEVLGVAKDADTDTVRRAYRRLMRSAHPDHGGTAGMFRTVQAAYDALSESSAGPAQPAPPGSSWTPAPPEPPRSDPSAERRRAEKERIDEEYRRRRRQAYLDHQDDPWLAEFEARQGEEDRASRITEAEVLAGLREMIRRTMPQALYPVPEYWANNMVNATSVARSQSKLRDRIEREQKAAEAAAAKAKRDAHLAALGAREKALGPKFTPASRARRDLLALCMFRGANARNTSTVQLQKLRRQIGVMRRMPVLIGVGIPTVTFGVSIPLALLAYSGALPELQGMAANLFGVSSFLSLSAPFIAFQVQAARVEPLLQLAEARSPYQSDELDREQWVEAAEQAAGITGPSTPSSQTHVSQEAGQR